MAVNWNYFDKFETVNGKYLPSTGEGETKATQIVTAVNKLVYKYYNDGDIFDNTYFLDGWANDLSSYANWLFYYTTTKAKVILDDVATCHNESEYEELLKELAEELLKEEYLTEQNNFEKVSTIYDCSGKFKFVESNDDEDDYYNWDDEDDEDEED